jgi:WD40 repeat protein
MDQPTSDGAPRVPILMRFVDAHRLCVTGEWFDFHPAPGNGDTWFVDLDRGRVVTPPAAFADLAFPTYSADGRHALLRDRKGRMQLWQVEPWRPLSPLADGRMIKIPDDVVLDPDLRFALDFGESASAPQLFDPRRMTKPRPLALPPHESFSAWAESANGAELALGTSNGQVILIDPVTLAARQLPAPAGSEVTWLAFSEDDAWLAATRRDGSAFAFDVASGDLLHAGQMQHAFETTRIEISHRDRLVVGSGLIGAAAGDGVLWRLPEQAPMQSEATRLLASPTRVAHAGPHWMSVAFATGLVATADAQGEVRLWRLPGPSTLNAVPPRLVPGSLYTDGAHVVDTDYDRVRVVSLAGHAATSWLPLPPPIAFAELVDRSRTLVAVARTTLHVLDAATLARTRTSVPLRATPQRFTVSADGRLAALSFGHNGASGLEERIEIRDLAGGARIGADDIVVKGPLRHMALSPDAARLLTVGPDDGSTDVFDTRTLARVGRFGHDPTEPVIAASFTADSRELWLVTRNIDETQADNPLMTRWDPVAGVREQRRVPGAWPYGVASIGDKPFLASKARLILDPGGADEHTVSSGLNYSAELSAAFAVSHDGRLIAHGSGRFVQLYDAATLAPVGAPLQTGKSPLSILAQLAFSDDDRHLLARTQSNWHAWPIAADERTAAELRRDAELLAPHEPGPRVLDLADAAEHAHLRGRDPGPREAPEPRPARNVPRWIGGEPLPPRDASASPMLLDLGSVYNRAPASTFNTMNSVLPSLAEVPYGIARLDGVDYDWRGALELRSGFSSAVGLHHKLDLRSPIRGIRVPPAPIAALHVLLYAPESLGESGVRVYARVRVHYRDGSEAVLPIRTQREVLGWTEHDRPTPIGWVMGDALGMLAISRVPLFNDPRLPNPHPERPIATLDLETAGGADWSTPVFFAITAEPAGSEPGMAGPGIAEHVIAAAGSGKGAGGTAGEGDATAGDLRRPFDSTGERP